MANTTNKFIGVLKSSEIEFLHEFLTNNWVTLSMKNPVNLQRFYLVEQYLTMSSEINKRHCTCHYKGLKVKVEKLLQKYGQDVIEAYEHYFTDEPVVEETKVVEEPTPAPKKRGRPAKTK